MGGGARPFQSIGSGSGCAQGIRPRNVGAGHWGTTAASRHAARWAWWIATSEISSDQEDEADSLGEFPPGEPRQARSHGGARKGTRPGRRTRAGARSRSGPRRRGPGTWQGPRRAGRGGRSPRVGPGRRRRPSEARIDVVLPSVQVRLGAVEVAVGEGADEVVGRVVDAVERADGEVVAVVGGEGHAGLAGVPDGHEDDPPVGRGGSGRAGAAGEEGEGVRVADHGGLARLGAIRLRPGRRGDVSRGLLDGPHGEEIRPVGRRGGARARGGRIGPVAADDDAATLSVHMCDVDQGVEGQRDLGAMGVEHVACCDREEHGVGGEALLLVGRGLIDLEPGYDPPAVEPPRPVAALTVLVVLVPDQVLGRDDHPREVAGPLVRRWRRVRGRRLLRLRRRRGISRPGDPRRGAGPTTMAIALLRGGVHDGKSSGASKPWGWPR